MDQYNSFTQQRDQLNERKEELDKSAEAINDLIKVLDQRKDEAIDRTFNTVRKFFAETFEKLEPKGRGQLIMLRRAEGVSLEIHLTITNGEFANHFILS